MDGGGGTVTEAKYLQTNDKRMKALREGVGARVYQEGVSRSISRDRVLVSAYR